MAVGVVSPAPMRMKSCSAKIKNGIVKRIAIRIVIIIEWTATMSAPFLSFAPILREIADPPPIPNPADIASAMKKKGKTKPTAASASGPRPETQRASIKL